ncbi:MAG: YihY/virulence factor BrkB family protein [Kineosporiaceae bacterium]
MVQVDSVRGTVPGVADQGGPEVGVVRTLIRLIVGTVRVCMRYRVTGLAAEAGFFALLSLPPLVLGLVASLGFVGDRIGGDVIGDLRARIAELAGTFLTSGAVGSVILPTFDEVVGGGRFDIVSIGFLLSLWSGSRVLNVYVDTVSIMYGVGGLRGIVRTRALSFSLYVAGLLLGIVVIPLVLIGPGLLSAFLSQRFDGIGSLSWLGMFYWPVVTVLSLVGLTTLYHVATPVRSRWRRDLPGAVLALLLWVLASFGLRLIIGQSVGGASIYGPLATPIVVLIWLYFLAISVLIGAALNAAIEDLFPDSARARARARARTRTGAGAGAAGWHPITPLPQQDDRDRPAPDGPDGPDGPGPDDRDRPAPDGADGPGPGERD